MKLGYGLPAALVGSATINALVMMQPAAIALTGEQVNDVARNITVLITAKDAHGSGVIISRSGQTYYVLTAKHVVSIKEDYKIVTPDKQAYAVDYSKVKLLAGKDLAVLEFTSNRDYQVAKLVNSDLAKEGSPVFISGWPAAGGTGQLIRQFTDGRISGFLIEPVDGYKMVYTNISRRGMSGGPVLDAGGRVVAIHGLGDTEDPRSLERQGLSPEAAASIASLIKPGFNYAIPINAFLSSAPQANLFLSLQVENTPAPELGAPYVVKSQTDERDRIDNLNSVLNTVNTGVNVIRGIFGF